MLLIQDTHSDGKNEGHWRTEWPGQVFLSLPQLCWTVFGSAELGGNPVFQIFEASVCVAAPHHGDFNCTVGHSSTGGVGWLLLHERLHDGCSVQVHFSLVPAELENWAVITLLPKKGHLQDLNYWRRVSFLCGE